MPTRKKSVIAPAKKRDVEPLNVRIDVDVIKQTLEYARYIDSPVAYVVERALSDVFNRDTEFQSRRSAGEFKLVKTSKEKLPSVLKAS